MAKKVIEHTTRSTNMETGEFQEVVKSITVKTDSQEEFFIMFIKSMSSIFAIKSAVDIRVLMKLCQSLVYNTGEIRLATQDRHDMLEELGISNNHLTNSLRSLRDLGIITGQKGVYRLNPIIAWKGDLKARAKVLKKMQLDFKIQYQSTKFD